MFMLNNDSDCILLLLQATSVEKYWEWVETKLIPQLYGGLLYNGDLDESLQRYAGDKVSFILGYAIIRQLRIKRGNNNYYYNECVYKAP